ncbi:MAG: hypothetical protein INH43_03020 [Acidobacteriaceae bacterium]|nr:hypothetical protein [Acidobacteriaceae bacterium]
MPYTRTYDNLWLITLTPEQHQRTCNYWYLVQQNFGPFTAFTTRAALLRWMEERGLSVDLEKVAPHKQHSSLPISGSFREAAYLGDADTFQNIAADAETRQLSNAEYTLGKITHDEDGLRTVHYLNCNVRTRQVFNYQESRDIHCGSLAEAL